MDDESNDIAHYRWAISRRADIQYTLLAIYRYVRETPPAPTDDYKTELLDHVIAAAFSLWRAAFLAEAQRTPASVLKAQEEFLAVVISTNAVSFLDDRRNSAWTVAFYLDNAGNRVMAAKDLVTRHDPNNTKLSHLENLPTNPNHDIAELRRGWDATHTALNVALDVLRKFVRKPRPASRRKSKSRSTELT